MGKRPSLAELGGRAPPRKDRMKTCNVCQTKNVWTARFCTKCGALLPAGHQSELSDTPAPPGWRYWWDELGVARDEVRGMTLEEWIIKQYKRLSTGQKGPR